MIGTSRPLVDRYAATGLTIMIVTQLATFAGVEPFASWNTPIAWTGFILFADSVVYQVRGDSWIRSSPREFIWLALASIPLWILFEGYNRVIDNWYYTGLPDDFWLRQFGFAWSFATIWPAIFEAADLVAVARAGWTARRAASPPLSVGLAPAVVSIAIGAVLLAWPFFVASSTARYLAAPVWLGFILLLEPVNRRLGLDALTCERAINLALAGLLCGFLWEFWNYWSRAKWHYTVPILERVKLFEMPLPGYFGFPAFALECFTMYVFVRAAFTSRGRAIAA